MEHHSMIAVHHEEINPPQHQHLAHYPSNSAVTAWQPGDVGKGVKHGVSESLSKRYPYPSNAVYDPLEQSVAYGRNAVPKTMMVLRKLVDASASGEAVDEEECTIRKRANIKKLLQALCDHTVIGDAVSGDKLGEGVALLKELLSDADVQVRTAAAAALGRLATLTQGRKSICETKCAEVLAHMLEDVEGVEVRLEAGRTLQILTRSIDGTDMVAESVSDGRVVQKMVRALLAISAKKSQIETPGLVAILLESLSYLLKADKAVELALSEQVMPFVVYTLRRRRYNAEALKTVIALAGHMHGKKAAIEAGALQAICGLLASHKATERQLSARAVLLLCVDQEGKKKAMVVVPNLAQQLYEEDHDMYMNALLALRSISEWPESRAMVLKVLEDDPEMLAEVMRDQQMHLAAFRYQPNAPPRV